MRGGRGRGRGGERVGDLAGLSVGVEDDGEGRVCKNAHKMRRTHT